MIVDNLAIGQSGQIIFNQNIIYSLESHLNLMF